MTSRKLVILLLLVACSGDERIPPDACDDGPAEPSRATLDCEHEFEVQATRPADASLPGAMTIKTIVDQTQEDAVHFMDTATYPLHRSFAIEHLDWPPGLDFNGEYLSPQRRFLLGSITHYDGPDVWAYELAPYDTASPEMIARAFHRLADSAYFGESLHFHPTSVEQEARVVDLPDDIPVVTTDDLYRGIDYQPLNLGETIAQVRILSLEELATGYVSPREIAVLDRVPNDISVVAGVVTAEFQTPLSHVNVLSQQRGTPNMGLRDAQQAFAEHDGLWVHLTVGAFDWTVEPATQDEADRWWEDHRPDPVEIEPPDSTRIELIDIDDVGLADVPAVGGKAAHFGELRDIEDIVVPDAFVVPVSYYTRFVEDAGLVEEIDAMLADERFRSDGVHRRGRLEALQDQVRGAPVDPVVLEEIEARIVADFGDARVRLRSSTNAEDLRGHSGAGLYTSLGAKVGDPADPVVDAIRGVWASLWTFRAFEEREYVGIDHHQVAMAILVHPAYTDEAANGVAITANPFDPGPTGEDGFYVNAQTGETSVVQPDPGVIADQLLYFHFHAGQPATYYTHSSLVPEGETVLTRRELFELGRSLAAIREHFRDHYEPPEGFAMLPMDVELKLVGQGEDRRIEIKQARPWPGRGGSE